MRQLFSYKGRIGRVRFALTFGAMVAALILVASLGKLVLRQWVTPAETGVGWLPEVTIFYWVQLFFMAPFVLILAAAWAKRLHDVGVSGWFQLILAVPVIKYAMLALFILPGTEGPNKYGEKPQS
jgi:uncharacterized membrane protein YhaH (DUF805 family)